MSCSSHRAGSRKVVKKIFENWRTKVLLTVGVETIGPAISSSWDNHCTSQDFSNFEPVLTDFDASEEHCPICIIGSSEFKSIMSVRDDSGVSSNSTTPAVSPRVNVLNSLCNSNEPQMNPEMIQQLLQQQAVQLEMYHNMQMMMQMHMAQGGGVHHPLHHLGPIAPHLPLSAEMQKMIMDGQISYPNPATIAQQQFLWHQMMVSHMHRMQLLHKEVTERQKPEPAKQVPKEERPLDLSRKSGLEGIMEIENAHVKKSKLARLVEEGSTPYDSDEGGTQSEIKFRAPKRNYTQIDLEAAVSDIRNGKLGTRRASVVYGIPRSTLRNKIYKLEAADENGGIVIPYKRKKKEITALGEEKPGEEQGPVEEDKSTSNSPSDESSNNSADMNDSNPTDLRITDDNDSPPKLASIQETIEAVRLNSANGWPATIWATLFSANGSPERQPKKFDSKKEENDWKKSRPKRGQYRKYDKNALDEAVQSVRRGEMSVHRAGSFYGVPHSTLEYKVKERNLLRKKKVDTADKNAEEITSSAVDLALHSLQEVLSN